MGEDRLCVTVVDVSPLLVLAIETSASDLGIPFSDIIPAGRFSDTPPDGPSLPLK
jgi:hypothetical protein